MRDFKVVVAGGLAVLVAIVAFQNTEQVQTDLLFTSVTMPRAILLFATGTIGFVAGAIMYPRIGRSRPN
jgi:uncharacterized integral membrane protein